METNSVCSRLIEIHNCKVLKCMYDPETRTIYKLIKGSFQLQSYASAVKNIMNFMEKNSTIAILLDFSKMNTPILKTTRWFIEEITSFYSSSNIKYMGNAFKYDIYTLYEANREAQLMKLGFDCRYFKTFLESKTWLENMIGLKLPWN